MRCEMKLTVATVQLLVQSAPLPCVCGHVRHSPKGRLELLMPLGVATACEDTARQALREAALQVSPCTHTRAVHPYRRTYLWLLAHALGEQSPWCYACGAWRAAHSALSAHPLPCHASGAFAAHWPAARSGATPSPQTHNATDTDTGAGTVQATAMACAFIAG